MEYNTYSPLDRVRIVLTSIVTWFTFAAMAVSIVADELAAMIGADHPVVALLVAVVAWIAVAIAIITRVTTVLPAARGLTPPEDESIPWTEREIRLMQAAPRFD